MDGMGRDVKGREAETPSSRVRNSKYSFTSEIIT